MKIKIVGYIVISMFMFGLIIIPFTFASSKRIGTDPEDDILEVDLLELNSMLNWLDDNYFNKRDPDFKLLYNLNPDWFKTENGPNSIDIIEWGLINYGNDNGSLYIKVDTIVDYIDGDFSQIDILVIYKDVSNNEEIQWFGELEYEDDVLTDNDYKTDFNYDTSYIEGEVDIHKTNNTYEIYFDTTWMTETDDDVILDNMYGLVFGYSFNSITRENVIVTYFDFLPNSYYGQAGSVTDDSTDSIFELTDTILFAVIVLAFLIVTFIIAAYFNKGRKGRGSNKRTGRKY